MHIYQPFNLTLTGRLARTEFDPEHDFEIAALIAAQAQTVIFHAEQVLALRLTLERFAESVDYRLPFTNVILQFDRPVSEQLFFDLERPYQNDPALLAETTQLWDEAGLALHGWSPADHRWYTSGRHLTGVVFGAGVGGRRVGIVTGIRRRCGMELWSIVANM